MKTIINFKNMQYKEVVHTINNLYKIKEINRKNKYNPVELRLLVANSPIGKETIDRLKELGVTRKKLLEFNLTFFNKILGYLFNDK